MITTTATTSTTERFFSGEEVKLLSHIEKIVSEDHFKMVFGPFPNGLFIYFHMRDDSLGNLNKIKELYMSNGIPAERMLRSEEYVSIKKGDKRRTVILLKISLTKNSKMHQAVLKVTDAIKQFLEPLKALVSFTEEILIRPFKRSPIDTLPTCQPILFIFKGACRNAVSQVKQLYAEQGVPRSRMIEFEEYSDCTGGNCKTVVLARFAVSRNSVNHKRVMEITQALKTLL